MPTNCYSHIFIPYKAISNTIQASSISSGNKFRFEFAMLSASPETRGSELVPRIAPAIDYGFGKHCKSQRKSLEAKKKIKSLHTNRGGTDSMDPASLQDVSIMRYYEKNSSNRMQTNPSSAASRQGAPRFHLASRSLPPSVVTNCSSFSENQDAEVNDHGYSRSNATEDYNQIRNPCRHFKHGKVLTGKHGHPSSSTSPGAMSKKGTACARNPTFSISLPSQYLKTKGGIEATEYPHTTTRSERTTKQHSLPLGSYPTDGQSGSQLYNNQDRCSALYGDQLYRSSGAVIPSHGGSDPPDASAFPSVYGGLYPSGPMSYVHANQGPYSTLMKNKPEAPPVLVCPTKNQGPYSVLVKNTHFAAKLQLPAWIGPKDVLQGDSEMGLSVFSNYREFKLSLSHETCSVACFDAHRLSSFLFLFSQLATRSIATTFDICWDAIPKLKPPRDESGLHRGFSHW